MPDPDLPPVIIDEAYIKANKSGLQLFANELLKASKKVDDILEDSEKNIIPFDTETKWITGNIWLGYIEPKAEDRVDFKKKSYKKIGKNIVAHFIIYSIAAILLLIFISGIVNIISWFS